MALCWETRGCDDEMQSRCPHSLAGDTCPAECHYAWCDRPTRKVTDDIVLLLNPDLDYDAAVKEGCRVCEFFLTNGPATPDGPRERHGNPNRFLL